LLLTLELVGVLLQAPLRGRERRPRRAQRVQFVLRVELRQHLIRRDPVAYARRPLEHPPADAEGERRFLLRQDLAGENDRLTELALLCDHDANRVRRRSLGRRLALAARGDERKRRSEQDEPSRASRNRRKAG